MMQAVGGSSRPANNALWALTKINPKVLSAEMAKFSVSGITGLKHKLLTVK
jgi:hypothetical protein